MALIRCFLCQRKDLQIKNYKLLESCSVPASRKCISEIMLWIARQAKLELYLAKNDYICCYCFKKLSDFDTILVDLVRKQSHLAKLLEKAALPVDSDLEDECYRDMTTLEELSNENFFDDICISENEIEQVINDVDNKEEKHKVSMMQPELHSQALMPDSIPCNLCAMKFRSRSRFNKHLSQVHSKYSCELCSFSHQNEDYVMLHMNVHLGKKETQCRFCLKEFTKKMSTIRHMETHINQKKYQCDKCGLCFSQTTVLYNHKLQHEAEENPLKCEICKQMFKTKRTYRHHMITHRADRPRHSCDFCSKTFTEKYTLKVHRKTHVASLAEKSIADEDEFPIENTNPTSTVPDSSSQNISMDAGVSIKFNCVICNQIFVNKDQLNKHMEKEHDVILKSLTLTNFSQYEVVSRESNKYCQICGQYFCNQSNLNFHLQNVHGTE